MAKSLMDQLQEQLEGVENVWLALAVIMLFLTLTAGLTVLGVYFYTRH